MSEQVVIDPRFRGPPEIANGGYACGTLAAHVEPAPAVEVTLRAPVPLDTPLQVERTDGRAMLINGERVFAEAVPAEGPRPDVPPPVSVEQARRASREAPNEEHPLPGCFVCGPERAMADGLGVVCGKVPGRETELIAAPLATEEWMAGRDGGVAAELVWAALDCPSGISSIVLDAPMGFSLLGRLTVRLLEPVDIGTSYAVVGWPIERDGRKYRGAAAILAEDGRPLAVSRSTWIELRDPPERHAKPG